MRLIPSGRRLSISHDLGSRKNRAVIRENKRDRNPISPLHHKDNRPHPQPPHSVEPLLSRVSIKPDAMASLSHRPGSQRAQSHRAPRPFTRISATRTPHQMPLSHSWPSRHTQHCPNAPKTVVNCALATDIRLCLAWIRAPSVTNALNMATWHVHAYTHRRRARVVWASVCLVTGAPWPTASLSWETPTSETLKYPSPPPAP